MTWKQNSWKFSLWHSKNGSCTAVDIVCDFFLSLSRLRFVVFVSCVILTCIHRSIKSLNYWIKKSRWTEDSWSTSARGFDCCFRVIIFRLLLQIVTESRLCVNSHILINIISAHELNQIVAHKYFLVIEIDAYQCWMSAFTWMNCLEMQIFPYVKRWCEEKKKRRGKKKRMHKSMRRKMYQAIVNRLLFKRIPLSLLLRSEALTHERKKKTLKLLNHIKMCIKNIVLFHIFILFFSFWWL